jgi:hypothetical protein
MEWRGADRVDTTWWCVDDRASSCDVHVASHSHPLRRWLSLPVVVFELPQFHRCRHSPLLRHRTAPHRSDRHRRVESSRPECAGNHSTPVGSAPFRSAPSVTLLAAPHLSVAPTHRDRRHQPS